jgi:hypothetical protein
MQKRTESQECAEKVMHNNYCDNIERQCTRQITLGANTP